MEENLRAGEILDGETLLSEEPNLLLWALVGSLVLNVVLGVALAGFYFGLVN
ncbi:hypothetical protein LB523_05990 [Mesorhizobium sp. ESP-6-4]|uniref:hypothetical protein n=1 Tax=unclassified Mesorhizobium TaxID=325217 RepID=UPI001CCC650E|nr:MULTISPECIES: hypothetical protein [unclassified Mesorhizobium]MBZ9658588.1 hypothetical protein [Mesorhizobium sp. ESP-6-4]MBZ9766816.1 hypothetical protein [Mesorhizobium sp. CA6]MBZ9841251.1 hypothetical protein [Mesorhizobium sp. CA5]